MLTPPAFWMPDRFTESVWIEHAPFAFWVIDAHRPRVLVELGTHHGFSYLAFCQAVERLGTGTRCYAVDTWEGDVHAGFYGKEVLERLREYHDPRYGSFSELIQSTFDDAARHFPDGNVDLLHIDGTHLRETVQVDFDTWLPKMSTRGVILFHDINVHRDDFGDATVWDSLKERYPHFEFDHGHGLGVLGVGAESVASLQALWSASQNPEEAATVRQAFARLGDGVADRAARLRPPQPPQQPGVSLETIEHRLRRPETTLTGSLEDIARAEHRAAALETQLERTAKESAAWRQRSDALDAQARSQAVEIEQLQRSPSWRGAAPFRAAAGRLVPVRRGVRRGLKVVWWTVTLQLPKRLRIRRLARQPVTPLPTVYAESQRATAPGRDFEDFAPAVVGTARARVVAFHLPQFHHIPENDRWWGRGFTEWRNVGRGLPRFVGHHQPRLPRDLGFYDLSHPDTLRRQAKMARASGIEAFCFYYYRFNTGRLLETPIERFLSDPAIDIGFCLMWANENWTRTWDGFERDVLAEQTYPATLEDELLPDLARHFADHRYLRVDGRPLFVIYRPGSIPDAAATIARWRARLEAEFAERPLMLMALGFGDTDPRRFDLDGAVEFPPHKPGEGLPSALPDVQLLDPQFAGEVRRYDDLVRSARREPVPPFPLVRTVAPSWDNEARRPGRGLAFTGSTPAAYRVWLDDAIDFARRHPFQGQPLVFVNAWNEWAEAAYLEPDVHFGAAYLNATSRAVRGQPEPTARRAVLLVGHDAHRHGAQVLLLAIGRLLSTQFGLRIAFLLLDGGELLDDYRALGDVTVLDPNDPGLRDHLLGRRDDGFSCAITNTVVTGGVVPALKEAGYRVVSLVHELPEIITERGWESRTESLLASADIVVFPSESARDRFVEVYTGIAATTVVRPQGMYHPPLAPDEIPTVRKGLRQEHDWGEDITVVLGVGFGDTRKGLDLFIATAALAEQAGASTKFVWVGDVKGGIDRWLTAWPLSPSTLLHIPFTPSVADWYAAADVLFVSSREDAFPSTVLEAIAAGMPPVAFRGCTGAEDLVSTYGELIEAIDARAALRVLRRFAPVPDRVARSIANQNDLLSTHRFDDYGFDLLRLFEPSLRKVSVVVPNYNYARYLPDRLASVFAQTYPIFEVLVLDDASTDDSLPVATETAAVAGRAITILPRATNSGSVFGQWRTGVENVRGEFVWIAEADDVADAEFLGWLMYAAHDRTVLTFTDSRTIDADGAITALSYQGYYATVPGGSLLASDIEMEGTDFARELLSTENLLLSTSAMVMRRGDLAAVLMSEADSLLEYSFAGDWHVYLHLLQRGRVSFVARPLNAHRRHARGATGSATAATHVSEIRRAHEEVGRLYTVSPDLVAAQADYRRRVLEQMAYRLHESTGFEGGAADSTELV